MSDAINVPDAVRASLEEGAALAVSISGGKDSQAMLIALAELHAAEAWPGDIYAIHADLGRAEWQETPYEAELQAKAADVPLVIVSREKGDLIDRFQERRQKLEGTGKPFWSSAAQRYCTSDMKRGPIDKYLRRHDHVVCAMGLRADESDARAKKEAVKVRKEITTKRFEDSPPCRALHQWGRLQRLAQAGLQAKMSYDYPDGKGRYRGSGMGGRLALDWNPILRWSEAEVWHCIGHSPEILMGRRRAWQAGRYETAMAGWNAHPAYVRGNQRLSCALCILASRGDLINGARHNPHAFRPLLQMERETGVTFRQDLSLEEIDAAVERGEQPQPSMQLSLSCSA